LTTKTDHSIEKKPDMEHLPWAVVQLRGLSWLTIPFTAHKHFEGAVHRFFKILRLSTKEQSASLMVSGCPLTPENNNCRQFVRHVLLRTRLRRRSKWVFKTQQSNEEGMDEFVRQIWP